MTAQPFLLPAAALAVYAVLMAVNPARRVLRDGRRCVSRFPVLWFLVIAVLHFFMLSLLDAVLTSGLGESSAPAYAWRFVHSFLAAWLTGWLLASWVCLVDALGRSGRGPIPF